MTTDQTQDGVTNRPICKLCRHYRLARATDPTANLPDLVSVRVQREIAERIEQRRREEEFHASSPQPAFFGKPPEFHAWCAAHSGVQADDPDPITGEAPAYYFACTSMNTRDAPCQRFEDARGTGAAPARHSL